MKNSGFLGKILMLALIALALGVTKVFIPSIGTILLVGLGIVVLLIVLLVILVIVFSREDKKEEEKKAYVKKRDAATDRKINEARTTLMSVRRSILKIKDHRIKEAAKEICPLIEKIITTVKSDALDINESRQFFNYYLPTMDKILSNICKLEAVDMLGEDMASSTLSCISDIKSAMNTLYRNLFANDKIDLAVEMEVLSAKCRRDGLIADMEYAEDEADEEELTDTAETSDKGYTDSLDDTGAAGSCGGAV